MKERLQLYTPNSIANLGGVDLRYIQHNIGKHIHIY